MDHNYRTEVSGTHEGYLDKYYKGRRPNGFYVPRFRNVGTDKQKDYLRGFAFGGSCERSGWEQGIWRKGFGADFKNAITKPGPWSIFMQSQAEMLPEFHNHVKINQKITDPWGMPTLDIDCAYGQNEDRMDKDIARVAQEMLEAGGFKNVNINYNNGKPGIGIHEVGTARMGKDPKTSILNGWNQIHTVKNVFVTDGASLPSQGSQNPSITFMALTARACDYAVKELKKRNL